MTQTGSITTPPTRTRRSRRIAKAVLAVLALAGFLLALAWLFGPREPARLDPAFDASAIGDDVEAYLARSEADVPNLRAGAGKRVVWAYPASRARTPIALVYVHGFSADGRETQPLMEDLSRRLGANLFVTRLAGHGRDGAAMAQATIGDWTDDLAEALLIGERLGERVVVVGNSTGATVATLAALRPDAASRMAGLVLISPNYRIADWRSFVLTIPFARDLIARFAPAEWGTPSENPSVNERWTTIYPSAALLPMARLVEVVRGLDFAAARVPALFVYAPGDTLVDAEETVRIAGRWGAPHESVVVQGSNDPRQHLLAGDVVSPATTQVVEEAIGRWIETLDERRDEAFRR